MFVSVVKSIRVISVPRVSVATLIRFAFLARVLVVLGFKVSPYCKEKVHSEVRGIKFSAGSHL